jgi:N-acetylmuramoyl-L-alanine amidase
MQSRAAVALFLSVMILALAAGIASFQSEKVAVFGAKGRVEVTVQSVNGTQYADVVEALRAETDIGVSPSRNGARIKTSNLDFEVRNGDKKVRVRGRNVPFSAPVSTDGTHLLLPVQDLAYFVSVISENQVTTSGSRMFIGESADYFQTQLRQGEPSSLLLGFRDPVNPRISADGKQVTLEFTREPATFSQREIEFQDKTIQKLTYNESGAGAQVVISGTVPLMARFENGNRTIVISATPEVTAPTPSNEPTEGTTTTAVSPTPSEQTAAENESRPSASVAPGTRAAIVAIDASHGGADAGVRFNEKLLEKDVSLAIAEKIRAELSSRGISSIMLRSADQDIGSDERAERANAASVSYYVSIHAGQSGTGVRVYSPMMQASAAEQKFVRWDSVQSFFVDKSTAFAAGLASEFGQKKIPVRQLHGNVSPVQHVAAAAVSIEVAPNDEDDDGTLQAAAYQQKIAQAVAMAIAQERSK